MLLAVVEIVKRANQTDLMLFYGLPAYAKDDVDALLTTISRVNKLVKKVRTTSPSLPTTLTIFRVVCSILRLRHDSFCVIGRSVACHAVRCRLSLIPARRTICT
jgi:hypothetical protein